MVDLWQNRFNAYRQIINPKHPDVLEQPPTTQDIVRFLECAKRLSFQEGDPITIHVNAGNARPNTETEAADGVPDFGGVTEQASDAIPTNGAEAADGVPDFGGVTEQASDAMPTNGAEDALW
ncbi:hypothetical protein CDV55_101806 [Aspergillus turcosus]|nr:hypothetical protein CDV55_101806 [Aspergillus turcosus]